MNLKVHKVSLESRKGMPGEVLEISKQGVVVAAGEAAVRLVEIQPPGKKKMSAHDFTLGQPDFKPGVVLT